MHYSFNALLDACPDERSAMDFLLDSQPYLSAYEKAKQHHYGSHIIPHPSFHGCVDSYQTLHECNRIHQEFLCQFQGATPVVVDAAHWVTGSHDHIPILCDNCHATYSFREIVFDASWVCGLCGMGIRYGIGKGELAYNYDEKCRLPPPRYMYRPILYLQRLLNERQGQHKGKPFLVPLLRTLSHDFISRGISDSQVTADVMKQALKRNQYSSFYPCRWALAKSFNSSLDLVQFSDYAMASLKGLFLGTMSQLPSVIKQLGILTDRKNFISYPFFAQQGFLHLGFPEYAAVFESLKSHTRQAQQTQILREVWKKLS